MLGDLAMEGDEEFPELSEDTGDVLECVRTDQYSAADAPARAPQHPCPLARHPPPQRSLNRACRAA
jgi:hypothetical protein